MFYAVLAVLNYCFVFLSVLSLVTLHRILPAVTKFHQPVVGPGSMNNTSVLRRLRRRQNSNSNVLTEIWLLSKTVISLKFKYFKNSVWTISNIVWEKNFLPSTLFSVPIPCIFLSSPAVSDCMPLYSLSLMYPSFFHLSVRPFGGLLHLNKRRQWLFKPADYLSHTLNLSFLVNDLDLFTVKDTWLFDIWHFLNLYALCHGYVSFLHL